MFHKALKDGIMLFEKEPVFTFSSWVLNKVTIGTIFLLSLAWRDLDWGLNLDPSALEASILSLGFCFLLLGNTCIDEVGEGAQTQAYKTGL